MLARREKNWQHEGRSQQPLNNRKNNESGGFCCQVPPNPAWTLLRRQGFRLGYPNRLRGLSNRSIVVVGNYIWSDNVGPIPGKSSSFRPSSILFRPRRRPDTRSPTGPCPRSGLRWRRRVLPPGPKGLLRRAFIAIAGLRRHPQYKPGRLTKKDRRAGVSRPPARGSQLLSP